MADYRVTDTELTSIANAIRTKGATQASLEFPTGFVTAIDNIPTGREPVLQSKTVTENGTVTPDAGYDGLSSVVVNVQGGGGSAILLADNAYSTSGSYTYDKTVTVPESGTYKIAVQAYTSNLTVKINNVAQALTMEVSSDYTRLYSATISMSAGDVINIYATSSGRSTVTAFIIKE